MTEHGMAAQAVGASVLADFDTIFMAVVPELAGRIQAVAFDAESGSLNAVPGGQQTGARRERPRPARPGTRRMKADHLTSLCSDGRSRSPFGRTFTFADPDGYHVTLHDRA
ncbi:hypothetical protein [Streptomyces sp. st140]|uniref:hypothetical protein n=1 Tax=Streptomyces sp. st140 TaxID=1828052 RepID=UPI0027BA90F2|nr:hypothetical protein [Streptomyces sp. st140]